MATIYRDGFTLLSGSDSSSVDRRDLNIIFVHGLRGHPRRTWSHRLPSSPGAVDGLSKDNKSFWGFKKAKGKATEQNEPLPHTPDTIFWPEEYLVPDIPQARIWTYGYNADVIGLFQANSKNSVSQHGRDLAVRLEREIDNEDPIIFVAHSLGGILVKDALYKSEQTRERTKLVVFLGTPHRGSGYASWGEIASNLSRLGLQDSNKRIVQTLEVNSEVLDHIHEEFKSIVGTHGIKVHSFQEAKGISGMKGLDNKVVDDFSSKLDLARTQETVESMDANHMEMARCSSRDDAQYRQICGVLKQFLRKGLSRKEVKLIDCVEPALHVSQFMVPFPRDENFVGRDEILAKIDDAARQDSLSKHKRVALVGLGGIGKSQIAIEYSYRVQKHRPQTSVFWIHASNAARFKQAYQDIADRVRLPGRDDPKANILQVVCDLLSDESNGRWMMILDNVDDADVFLGPSDGVRRSLVQECQIESWQRPLEAFLPQSRNGLIFLTSRNSAAAKNLVDTHGTVIQIEPMKEADSLALLGTRIAISDVANTEAVMLVQALEGIPLAITHAAAYIRARQPRVTIALYLDLFRESEANQADLLNNNDAKDLRRDPSTRDAVITTWQVSINQIQKTKPDAADLLALMSMFDRQGIPERLLHDGTRRLQFEEAIAPLLSCSLIRGQVEQKSFEMHRLVQLSTRKWVELSGQLQRWRSAAIKSVAREFPSGEYETWSECQELLPHSTAVLSHGSAGDGDILVRAAIHNRLGVYLLHRGEYATAKVMLCEVITEREKELGVNHPNTLISVNNLALVLDAQGRYKEAETMHQRALNGFEKELRVNHPDTLASLNNLAGVLNAQGRYKEAETMHQRALKEYEKELGVNHPDTLASINNLALVLERQKRYKEAETMHRRALKGFEKELGVNHPDTLASITNLALVLKRQKRYEEAETMQRWALEGKEQELRANHPSTLASIHNLALVLRRQKRYEEAETMQRRALEGHEKEFGANHPHTLTCVYNLAYLRASQKRYDDALALYARACTGYKAVLGDDHPTTIACQRHYAALLNEHGGRIPAPSQA